MHIAKKTTDVLMVDLSHFLFSFTIGPGLVWLSATITSVILVIYCYYTRTGLENGRTDELVNGVPFRHKGFAPKKVRGEGEGQFN